MVRTQIQLTEDQHRRLKRWARRRDVSLSEAVRRCVTAHLDAGGTEPDRAAALREALAVCGTYRDPEKRRTVARRHDDVLAEAYRQ